MSSYVRARVHQQALQPSLPQQGFWLPVPRSRSAVCSCNLGWDAVKETVWDLRGALAGSPWKDLGEWWGPLLNSGPLSLLKLCCRDAWPCSYPLSLTQGLEFIAWLEICLAFADLSGNRWTESSPDCSHWTCSAALLLHSWVGALPCLPCCHPQPLQSSPLLLLWHSASGKATAEICRASQACTNKTFTTALTTMCFWNASKRLKAWFGILITSFPLSQALLVVLKLPGKGKAYIRDAGDI